MKSTDNRQQGTRRRRNQEILLAILRYIELGDGGARLGKSSCSVFHPYFFLTSHLISYQPNMYADDTYLLYYSFHPNDRKNVSAKTNG